ncbi:cupin domain-containing protein [Rhabdothermincola salaria]|uniref:cupin domain-containing protein n=1 Tax=Rhabdothermincola salaria TaxID=2903142 RepID=UPI001E28AF0E|nr:cupin domain-containing protein [Rhabdothermincola salaria]MCD9624482.1 cupin domain-containing protein [Rhabdothermincola salaria]
MRLTITEVDGSPAVAEHPGSCQVSRGARLGPLVTGGDLRLVIVELEAGATMSWPAEHGEDAVYLLTGAVDVDGAALATGGALVLHAGGPVTLAATEASRLAHFWSTPSSVEDDPPAGRHLVGPDGWAVSGSRDASFATWFADSTCEGCDVTLMKVERDTPGNRGRAHTHSAEEIIFVIDGEIHLGAHPVPAGTAVHIPADTRYAVTCGDRHHAFLNYRAGPSTQHYAGDTEPVPETALGRGGRLVHAARPRS